MVVKFESGLVSVNNSYWVPYGSLGSRGKISAALEHALSLERHGMQGRELRYEMYADTALVTVITDSHWAVGLELVQYQGEWRVAEIDLRPTSRSAGDPSIDASLVAEALAGVQARSEDMTALQARAEEQMRSHGDFIQANLRAWKDKRRKKTNFEYAALAAAYATEVQAGNRKATQAVAETLGVSAAVAAQWLKEARKRRLLTPAERGRAAGNLTQLGALYTSADFSGFGQQWVGGKGIRELATRHGVTPRDVWAGLDAEGYARNINRVQEREV